MDVPTFTLNRPEPTLLEKSLRVCIDKLVKQHNLKLPQIITDENVNSLDETRKGELEKFSVSNELFDRLNTLLFEPKSPLISDLASFGELQLYLHNKLQTETRKISMPGTNRPTPSEAASLYTSFKLAETPQHEEGPEHTRLACLLYLACELLWTSRGLNEEQIDILKEEDPRSEVRLFEIPRNDEQKRITLPDGREAQCSTLELWALDWIRFAETCHWPGMVWFINDTMNLLHDSHIDMICKKSFLSVWVNSSKDTGTDFSKTKGHKSWMEWPVALAHRIPGFNKRVRDIMIRDRAANCKPVFEAAAQGRWAESVSRSRSPGRKMLDSATETLNSLSLSLTRNRSRSRS
ncbi:hypothetical protein F5Y16DRAFT_386906, partial [Xylariaceae sp. FL0255]